MEGASFLLPLLLVVTGAAPTDGAAEGIDSAVLQETASGCGKDEIAGARAEFKRLYDAGRRKAATEALTAVQQRCQEYLRSGDAEATEQRLWVLADLSLATFKTGELDRCRELIEPVEVDFVESGRTPRLSRVWSALAFNYSRCQCRLGPLCRQGSWLKDGYSEVSGRVHPTLPPYTVRVHVAFEDEIVTRRDGSKYFFSTGALSDLEVLSEGGGTVQPRAPVPPLELWSDPNLGFPPALEDMNFDGYLDLWAGHSCRGTANCCVAHRWLYDPKALRFVLDEGLSGLCAAEFDPAKKQVQDTLESSCETQQTLHQWQSGTLVDVERVRETCQGEKVIERSVGGEWKVVKPRRARQKSGGTL